MQNKQFEKIDFEKPAVFYSKFHEGSNAKANGILLLFCGIATWLFIAIIFSLNLSYDTEFTKYFTIIIFICFGIGFNIGGIFYLRLNRKYQAIIRPILENGLMTEGYISNVEHKRYYRGMFSHKGWRYKIDYTYVDDKGIEYSDVVNFSSIEKKEFGEKITVAFYNEKSIMLEFINIPLEK